VAADIFPLSTLPGAISIMTLESKRQGATFSFARKILARSEEAENSFPQPDRKCERHGPN
jgi:hypothetical protein